MDGIATSRNKQLVGVDRSGNAVYRDDLQKVLAAANVRKSRRRFRSKYHLMESTNGVSIEGCWRNSGDKFKVTMRAEFTAHWKFINVREISTSLLGVMDTIRSERLILTMKVSS
jgi:hypothetical protein